MAGFQRIVHVNHFAVTPPPPPRLAQAFSLLELLAVLAIVVLLLVAAVPAFNAITGAHSVTRATYDVAGLLELARSEAVTRQTYVWVGFGTTNADGNAELVGGAVYSRDGSGTNTNAANLVAVNKLIRIRNVALLPWADLKADTRALWTNQAPADVATNVAGLSFNLGKVTFQARTITFTPRGEATLAGRIGEDDGFDPAINVAFCRARGNTVPPGSDDAIIVVDGATGMTKILQIR